MTIEAKLNGKKIDVTRSLGIKLIRYSIDTENTLVRQALIKLGWTPPEVKPKCQAKIYCGVGKTRPCKRTAHLNSKYCFSHLYYNKE